MKTILILLALVAVCFAAIDSASIVSGLTPYLGEDFAKVAFTILAILVPFLWRLLAEWAVRRPTTWYWNPVTQSFVLKRIDKFLGAVFTKGVTKSNIRYEDNLPPEALAVKEQYAKRKYEITDPDPNVNDSGEDPNKQNGIEQ